jgi:Flp pilus assembly protein TadD
MIARFTALGLLALLAGCGSHRNDEAIVRDPDTASRLRVAETAAASGQTDIALSMYGAAASAAPDNVEAQSKYAGLLLKLGKPDLADQVLTKALARRPTDPALLRWRGVLQLQTGDSDGALKIFDRLLSHNKADLAALNGRGMALDLADRHEEAEQAYRTALSLAPNDIQSTNNLAISLLLADRVSEARDILLELSQRQNVPPRVLNNLAVAQAASGNVLSSNALLAGKPSADDIRALAAAFGAPPSPDDPAIRPVSSHTPRS